jgi:hypothetical protein
MMPRRQHEQCGEYNGAEQNSHRQFMPRELKDAIVLIATQFVIHVTLIDAESRPDSL